MIAAMKFDSKTRELARAQRYGHPLSCVMLDLDRFKAVNDTYGHLIGDRVLQHLADRLMSGMRASDFAARMGGEEFSCRKRISNRLSMSPNESGPILRKHL